MTRYYVVSDIHGFYNPLNRALSKAGFFDYPGPRKLIVCGDMMDRGPDTLKVQKFMNNLHDRGELIFVRGNHEDLMCDLIRNFDEYRFNIAQGYHVHVHNGTWGTALDLSGMDEIDALENPREFKSRVRASVFYSKLIPASVNYFETGEYIFTHGWIPERKCENCPSPKAEDCWRFRKYDCYDPDWRDRGKADWDKARWRNGMDMAYWYNVTEPGKTIVCGHWDASYGHSRFDNDGSEFGEDANFEPYFGKGVIAIDGCTAKSGIVNCFVLTGEEYVGNDGQKHQYTYYAN